MYRFALGREEEVNVRNGKVLKKRMNDGQALAKQTLLRFIALAPLSLLQPPTPHSHISSTKLLPYSHTASRFHLLESSFIIGCRDDQIKHAPS